ncbi:hypothetical protein [Pseudomonas japonica]|uniref:hypothetical protein n=1 Tax=Pseudomonas japonica TaxID=256466 RepID=UPI003A838901
MNDAKPIVCRQEIALAEFLRGKMQRLRNSYTLAFEAGWNACSEAPHLSPAWAEVVRERQRQLDEEGHTASRDDLYEKGQLADAAAAYAFWARTSNAPQVPPIDAPSLWPWSPKHWKPTDQRKMLVKAGALILAELARLDRLAANEVRNHG